MSTHKISFNEEISKIIPELSSNIIKYAPYLFCVFDQPLWIVMLPVLVCTTLFHQDNMSVCFIPPYTPLLYSKTGVYRGLHYFLLL